MIDTKKFYIVDPEGYEDWDTANCKMRLCYMNIPKIQVHHDEEEDLYFIVQRKKKQKKTEKNRKK